jgi:hypothetical protein
MPAQAYAVSFSEHGPHGSVIGIRLGAREVTPLPVDGLMSPLEALKARLQTEKAV